MISYRNMKEEDLGNVSNLYAESFKEYNFFKLTIGKSFKNEKSYFNFLQSLFMVSLKTWMRKYNCLVGVLDKNIVSAAILKDPSIKEVGIFDYILSGGVKLLKKSNPINILRFLNFLADAEKACKKEKGQAWYLESLAVNKDYQGQKLGSKMINECIIPNISKRGGNQLALITNSKINCKFYIGNGFTEFNYKNIRFNDIIIGNWSYYISI
ncbi:GNAT family N-acetyltransferase [Clostridium sp. SHJSY1]|uniref:GNAT family N-acetyltransferase n=1 Tax=Clostridium sp. SHJSY1 TaxID=2942483 RepID=UPI0028768D71|nr:GNAT family N-acetyltransferase [Clostridium sp. SHJSY1]MDS0525278.1 GNAT family N-acetyltransferase [Clostridium sp. SHJSY1]